MMNGGPWMFDNHILVLHELKPGEKPTEVPLHFAAFWVLYDLPIVLLF